MDVDPTRRLRAEWTNEQYWHPINLDELFILPP